MKKIILSSLVLSSLVMATESDLKTETPLITHTEFGYIETQGNTVTKTFNLEAKIQKSWQKHIFALTFDGQYASDKSIETKNKYLIELEYDYEITDRFAFDYLTGFKQDKFSTFNYQFYTGPGVKYKAIKAKKHDLSLESNILYSQDDIADINYATDGSVIDYPNPDDKSTATREDGELKDYVSFRVKAVYGWQIFENLKFDQELSYRVDLEDTKNFFAFSKTAFSSKFTDVFSAGISYKVDYVNMPSTDKEYTDRTLTANLIIDF
ncbi:MAG: DUF481 domain-containing protein [Campylobacterota bacterium]|nr:DUF481 domain-containing protein [Campylobacterota bacterium]